MLTVPRAVSIAGRRGRKRLSADHLLLKPTAPRPGQTLQDAVYQQLRDALMVGAFRPGERLSARAIAASLGTSNMPVKDALRRLVGEGALQSLPQSSFLVESLTARRYLELTEVRVRLETFATVKAVEVAPLALARTLADLNERNRKLRRGSAKLIRGKLLKLNLDFHFAIYAASLMPDVCEIIMATWLRTGPVFSLIEAELDQADDYQWHANIIEAIAKRNPVAASTMMEQHIRDSASRMARRLPL